MALAIIDRFASGLVGVWLFNHKRTAGAKDAFKVFISLKKSEIPQHGAGCMEFYTGTKTEIREAIAKTVPFLKEKQASSLKKLWAEYSNSETYIKLEHGHEGGSDSLASEVAYSAERPVDRRIFLGDFLDRFSNSVNH